MITVYAQRDDLVDKHKNLLDELKWSDDLSPRPNLVKAFPCDLNKGVVDDKGVLLPMTANIYVDDILTAAARRENMTKILAAIIKAILPCVEHPILQFDSVPSPLRSGTN